MNNFLIKNLYKNSEGQVADANDVQYRLWVKFIETMNDRARDAGQDAHWSGDSEGDYYGIVDGVWNIVGVFENIDSHIEIITIEQWNTRFIESLVIPTEEPTEEPTDVPMVTDYHGNLIPQSDAWLFSDDSCHAGEYFDKNEYFFNSIVVCLDHGDGYALREECAMDIDDNWFVEDRAEYYDLTWSEYNDQWVCENDDYVYYGYYRRSHTQGYFYSDECVEAGGEYYADSNVAEYHGWHWNDNRDCYVHEDDDDYESDEVQENNATYHKLERQFRFGENPKFSIGFEIEKEDSDVGLIHYRELYNSTGWCKEKDGSLNNDGYELVSPAFNLYTGDLEKEINAHADLLRLINGGHSSRCGGHINIASSEFNTEQLFEALSGFFPLLYAIYPHRIEQHYCKAKKKHRYYDKDKFSAVFIKDNVLEFRIFPAVKHYDNLLWRRDLMRIMCDNVNKSEADVLKMLINSNSKLHKHLRKIYDHESLIVRIERFIDHCQFYNNKKLQKVDFAKSKEIVATGVNSDDLAC